MQQKIKQDQTLLTVIDLATRENLSKKAENAGMTISAYIRKLIKDSLKNND
jgi:hypothetical protein